MDGAESQAVVRVVVAPVYGTNCYIVSMGTECVIVDAGGGVAPGVERVVEAVGLTPRAVLATHGHADHTWDAGPLARRYDVPFVVHAGDEYRIRDPFGSIDAPGAPVAETMAAGLAECGIAPDDYVLPPRIEPFDTTGEQDLAFGSVRLRAVHAPGHTEGSTLYLVGAPTDGDALTGDVLFAGTIGRTDLPGGDWTTMERTLGGVVGRLDPGWRVRPGHGPASSMRRELVANPFLARM